MLSVTGYGLQEKTWGTAGGSKMCLQVPELLPEPSAGPSPGLL